MRHPFFVSLVIAACIGTLAAKPQHSITLQPIGNFRTGVFADEASEITAFDPFTKRVFSVNAHDRTIDVIDLRDPSAPSKLFSIDLSPYGKNANSVAVSSCGLLAAAVKNMDKQALGKLLIFTTWGECRLIKNIEIGAFPDMVTFSPDGRYILVANEGQPSDDYTVDPEGSVSIIDLRWGPLFAKVATATFTRFNGKKDELIASGIRIFGPNATVAQDLEPEYIAISWDSKKAWVTLQENNAVAVVSIPDATVDTILPLGYKNYRDPVNKIDVSDKDGAISLANWPVYGMYMPDAIASYTAWGKTFLVTANEGDSREYDSFTEEERVKKLKLDPIAFPDAAELQKDKNLGRLKVTKTLGDIDGDGDYDKLFAFGGRSFSIWSADGKLIYDSGSILEEITAQYFPDYFNSDNEENGSFDTRSDDKGPEPEGIAIGQVMGATYAFIGLERIGGVMIFNITNPYKPEFVDYVNTRDFSGDPKVDAAGDLGPEGLTFIPAWQSPTFKPLLVVGYEISGSVGVFEIAPTGGCKK
jgi:2',3'-cyclic-nucleotide 2'-phosphodiesterase / 3'-nucleotidase / 5'-nucleotidase